MTHTLRPSPKVFLLAALLAWAPFTSFADDNTAPTIGGVSAVSGDEDSQITITEAAAFLTVADADGDTLTTSLAVGNGTLNATLSGSASFSSGTNDAATLSIQGSVADINATLSTLSYTGEANFNGSDTLTYSVTDGSESTAEATVNITVNNVNDDPVLAAVGYQAGELDTPFSITLSATDVDSGDTITFTAPSSANITTSVSGTTLTFTPTGGFSGTEAITITADDGNGGMDDETINVTFTARPSIDIAYSLSAYEGSTFALTAEGGGGVTLSDADSASLSVAMAVGNGTLSVALSGAATISSGQNGSANLTLDGTIADLDATLVSLEYTPVIGFSGTDTLVSTVSDGSLSTGQVQTSFVVYPNPVAEDDSATVLEGGASNVFNILANDISNTNAVDVPITLSASGGSEVFTNGSIIFSVDSAQSSENLGIQASREPDATNGATSMVNGTIFRGDGTEAVSIASIDGTLDGTGGKDLKVNILDPNAFSNGAYEDANSTTQVETSNVYTFPGWYILNERIQLDGFSTLLGFPTPEDTQDPANNSGTDNGSVSGTYSHVLKQDDPSTDGGNAVQLSFGGSSDSYGVVHGPTLYSAPAFISAGSTVEFEWRAAGASDAYDVYAYLLNTTTGDTLELLNDTGSSGSAQTNWATVTKSVDEAGSYAFIFIAGSFDFSGGRALGANLLVDGVKINQASLQPDVDRTSVDALAGLLQYWNTDGLHTLGDRTITATAAEAASEGGDTLAGNTGVSGGALVSVTVGSTTSTLSSLVAEASGDYAGYKAIAGENGSTLYLKDDGDAIYVQSGVDVASESFTYIISDGQFDSPAGSVTLNVTPVNDIPLIDGVASVSGEEDAAVAIFENTSFLSVVDPDGDTLTVSLAVTNGTLNVALSGTTISSGANDSANMSIQGLVTDINAALASLSYTGSTNYNGADTLTYSVTDGTETTQDATVAITVTPVNDLPVLAAVGDQNTNEDTPFSITLSATDVDQDNLTFSASNSTNITASVSGTTLTLTPAANSYGMESITITVDDGNNGTDTETINVTVAPVNDLPVLTAIGAQSVDEDNTKTLTLAGNDVEDATLVYNASSDSSEVNVGVSGEDLTLTPDANWFGTANITVTLTDTENGTDTETFAFTVNSVNDLPTIQNPGNQEFTEKDTLPVTLNIADVETASPAINVMTTNAGLQTSVAGTTLNLTADGWYGDASVTVTITDDDQATDSVTFDVHVIPYNIEPPIHSFPGAQTVDVCPQVYTFSLAPANGNDTANPIQVSDLDSPTLTTTLEVENGILTLPQTTGLQFQDGTANGTKKITIFGSPSDISDALNGLTYCGDEGYFGPDVLKLSTVDHGGLTDSDQVDLVIEIVAVETGVEEVDLENQAQRIASDTGKTLDTTVEPEIVIPEGNDELVKEVIFVEDTGGEKKLFVLPQIMNEVQTANPDTDGERTSVQVQYKDTDGGNITVDVPVVVYRPRVSVTERVQGLTQLNRVTGLYEQILTVENTMPYPMQAIRLYADGLAEGTTLHSSTGTGSGGIVDGMPYVQFNETILAQGSNEFKIELKSSSRTWDGQVNVLIELLPEPGEDPLSGELEGTELSGDTSNLSNGVYLNFFTESGVNYFIQYRSPSDSSWTTSNIPIVGDGRPAIWVDDGPPKTPSHPGSDGFPGRFYRVVVWEGAP